MTMHDSWTRTRRSAGKRRLSRRHDIRRWTAGVLGGLLLAGCDGSPRATVVDAVQARSTLVAVLTSWQEGDTPASWRAASPEVVVQDMDWMQGARLKSFEIIDEGQPVDANLHCRVKLTLDDPRRGEVNRTVTYLVGTDPVFTVFRQVGP